ncbi:uncharacterized protein [Cicer arietinum]|uniref:uncharacterized protein n=1 Tax=Cicer arietinum TaxID=3827 RepID=UPI003CC6519D
MVFTRSMTIRNEDNGNNEFEELRKDREILKMRMELHEAQMKKSEDLLAAIASKLGVNQERNSFDEGSEKENEGESHRQNANPCRWRKLEIPIFAGDDAYGWVQKLERYFALRGVTPEEKMQATMISLEGKALSWYQWWEGYSPNPTWESFKIAVVRRFQPSMIQNPFELLLSLKQNNSVEEYVELFEKYAGALREVNQDFVRGVFLNGLKEEIKAEVKLYELTNLSELIQKAILVEQKNLILTKKNSGTYTRSYNSYKPNSYSKVVTLEPQPPMNNNREASSIGSVNNTMRQNQSSESSRVRGDYRKLTSA